MLWPVWGGGCGVEVFFPEGQIRVHLCGQPVDVQRSFDGFHAVARQGLQQDPVHGQQFLFLNRRATQVKIPYWVRTGSCVWAKRLEEGRFVSDWSRMRTQELAWTALKLLLEGIVPARKHRFSVPENR